MSKTKNTQKSYSARLRALTRIQRAYNKELKKLRDSADNEICKAREKILLKCKEQEEALHNKYMEKESAVYDKYKNVPGTRLQEIRLTENLYESLFLSCHPRYSKFNIWNIEVCDDSTGCKESGLDSAGYLDLLIQDFNKVIRPVLMKIGFGKTDITFGRPLCNKPLGYCTTDPCLEQIGPDYYVEFIIKDLKVLSKLLSYFEKSEFFHYRDLVIDRNPGRVWYTVFSCDKGIVVWLSWNHLMDPIYKLGMIIQDMYIHSKFISTSEMNEFIKVFEDNIRPIGESDNHKKDFYPISFYDNRDLGKKYMELMDKSK